MSSLTVSVHKARVCIQAPAALEPSLVADVTETTLFLDDPVGLWEALTDALADEHGEHLREYLGGAK